MSKPFDVTLKHLLDSFAEDWMNWLAPQLGLPTPLPVQQLDADLSQVQMAVDKAFLLEAPNQGVLHLEPQASWDGELPERLLSYHALLDQRYGHPVYSVVILLRREANSPRLTGLHRRHTAQGQEYLRFQYSVIRVWEQPAQTFLDGGLGTLPLAVLTDDTAGHLEEVVDAISERMQKDQISREEQNEIFSTSFLLSGLRYDESVSIPAFRRIEVMRESSTYQYILREGMKQGLEKGLEQGLNQGLSQGLNQGLNQGKSLGRIVTLQKTLLGILKRRFGAISVELTNLVQAQSDPDLLEAVTLDAISIANPDDIASALTSRQS